MTLSENKFFTIYMLIYSIKLPKENSKESIKLNSSKSAQVWSNASSFATLSQCSSYQKTTSSERAKEVTTSTSSTRERLWSHSETARIIKTVLSSRTSMATWVIATTRGSSVR